MIKQYLYPQPRQVSNDLLRAKAYNLGSSSPNVICKCLLDPRIFWPQNPFTLEKCWNKMQHRGKKRKHNVLKWDTVTYSRFYRVLTMVYDTTGWTKTKNSIIPQWFPYRTTFKFFTSTKNYFWASNTDEIHHYKLLFRSPSDARFLWNTG
jgi:hypothetical protein